MLPDSTLFFHERFLYKFDVWVWHTTKNLPFLSFWGQTRSFRLWMFRMLLLETRCNHTFGNGWRTNLWAGIHDFCPSLQESLIPPAVQVYHSFDCTFIRSWILFQWNGLMLFPHFLADVLQLLLISVVHRYHQHCIEGLSLLTQVGAKDRMSTCFVEILYCESTARGEKWHTGKAEGYRQRPCCIFPGERHCSYHMYTFL